MTFRVFLAVHCDRAEVLPAEQDRDVACYDAKLDTPYLIDVDCDHSVDF